MTDPKLPKNRIIEKAKEFAATNARASSKIETLMSAIAKDEAYWLWVNEALFDSFTWASEAMAAKLNKPEVASLRRHLEKNDLHLARFDDPKAYQAIISEALSSDILSMRKSLIEALKSLEENTACVLKFTKDGPIATGYPHGIPFVSYFTNSGTFFIAYIDTVGANKVYSSSRSIPLEEDHIVKRVAFAVESSNDDFLKAQAIQITLTQAEARLEALQKFGKTVLK